MLYSVPARLGKGQGAKEIGHNLAREQPKFGHNLMRERHIIGHSLEREWPKFGRNPAHERNEVWAQFCGRSKKTWAQICKHFTSIDWNTRDWKHKNSNYILFIKKKINFCLFLNSGKALYNRAGCKTVRAGRSALRNMPSWNTAVQLATEHSWSRRFKMLFNIFMSTYKSVIVIIIII